jgi:hypothetical protein
LTPALSPDKVTGIQARVKARVDQRQGPMGNRVMRDRVCAPAPLLQHIATATPLPLHRRGPDWEASLQMLMGAAPVGWENPKQTPPRAKVMWELPPIPLSPITRPPLWEHLPSQMGHPVENPPPMTTMDMLMDSLRQTGPLPEIRAADAIPPEDPLFIYPITEAIGKSTVKSLMRPRRLLPRDLFLQL